MLIGVDASRAVATRRTGTETYSLRLIQALLGLETPHDFRLYFNRPPGSDVLSALNAQRASVRIIPFPRLWSHIRLGFEVARRPPDVLFVPSHVLPLSTRVPAVATIHDLGYRYYPQAHPNTQRWYLDWSTRHNARTAQVIVADSEATKSDLGKHYGVQAGKVIVAYPGIDDDVTAVDDPSAVAAALARYDITDQYVLHVGTLQPRKNLLRLVQAFGQATIDTTVQLVLAGRRGWLYDELFRQVRTQGLEERVRFVGYIADEDKAALLSGAVAYVFPSLYEGFGFPALEAQACRTPLICSNSSSLPEVAGDGAFYFDPHDVSALRQAVTRVLQDTDLRANLVEKGRRNVQRFSWEMCAAKVMGALEAAVGIHGDQRSAI